MSDLTYTALNPADHEWMEVGDSLLEITSGLHSGKCVIVNITQKEVDINHDGVVDQLNVKVSARMVDSLSGQTLVEGDSPIEIPAKVESVLLSALSEGTIVMSTWMANMIDDAIHRVLRQQSALAAINMIPKGG